jgi:uncharacterized protein (DUF1697 family)
VLPAQDVAALMSADPFKSASAGAEVDCFVSVLAERPAKRVALPIERPEGDAWEVRLFAVEGRFALCVRRRGARGRWYPNEVVEKTLGVAATTRNWATFQAIGEALERA